MKNYKLDLEKGDYITQTQRKLFPYALKWCLENGETSCRANRTYFNFDFDKLEVNINGIGSGNNNTYKIKEV